MIEIVSKYNVAKVYTDNIEPTATIVERIKPIYNFKA